VLLHNAHSDESRTMNIQLIVDDASPSNVM